MQNQMSNIFFAQATSGQASEGQQWLFVVLVFLAIVGFFFLFRWWFSKDSAKQKAKIDAAAAAGTGVIFTDGSFGSVRTDVLIDANRGGENAGNSTGEEVIKGLSTCTYENVTPEGCRVFRSTPRLEPELAAAIDRGINTCLRLAKQSGTINIRGEKQPRAPIQHDLEPSDFEVVIVPHGRTHNSDNVYTPDFLVPANQYRNHPDYDPDNDGYIHAAEMILNFKKRRFAIAEPVMSHPQALTVIEDVSRYGTDHIVIDEAAPDYAGQVHDHSKGGGHPIIE